MSKLVRWWINGSIDKSIGAKLTAKIFRFLKDYQIKT